MNSKLGTNLNWIHSCGNEIGIYNMIVRAVDPVQICVELCIHSSHPYDGGKDKGIHNNKYFSNNLIITAPKIKTALPQFWGRI